MCISVTRHRHHRCIGRPAEPADRPGDAVRRHRPAASWRWRLRRTDPSARRFVRRSTQYAPLAKTCAHRGSNLRSSPAVVATEGPGAEVLWRRLCARHRSEHQATPEIYPLCRELLPHRPVRRSSLGGGWRRLVRRARWPRGSWRFRRECRSAEWFHQLRTVPRCRQHFRRSRNVSTGVLGQLGPTEVAAPVTRRSVCADQPIVYRGDRGSRFFLLAPPGRMRFWADYSEPFDDNFDDNGLVF